MSNPKYPHLLSPVNIGPVTLRNRVVMAAMGISQSDGGLGERITILIPQRYYVILTTVLTTILLFYGQFLQRKMY